MTHPVRNLFAYILMSAGVILSGAGGLCTLGLSSSILVEALKTHNFLNVGLLLLLILAGGGIPFGIGIALFRLGRNLGGKHEQGS